MTEQVEIWGRRFNGLHIDLLNPARPHPIAGWNRYGQVPGTPYRGVTIGFAVMLRGRGLGVRWAEPTVRIEDTQALTPREWMELHHPKTMRRARRRRRREVLWYRITGRSKYGRTG